MFASIAPRYDLLNRLLSLGLDQRWRREMVRRLPELADGERVLDLCTGTGDVAYTIADAVGRPHVPIHASDFCEEMVVRAPAKGAGDGTGPAFFVSDAMALPYPAETFRAVTIAFGLRNVEDPPTALREVRRVLAPGGRLIVLEFSRPEGALFGPFYRFYFFRILPLIGRFLSGSGEAYSYLPESVWAFPRPAEVARRMEAEGLAMVEQKQLFRGALVLHVAERAPQ